MKNPPLSFVKNQLFHVIANRSTELITARAEGSLTEHEYHVMQFPAEAMSVIDKAFDQAVMLFNGKPSEYE
tara:strand:- start:269 stop:481 length:213 start_codon:yes stop_codon:yes gene_type:complete